MRYNRGMGLLDKIKPQRPQPKPTDLAFDADGNLLVRWDDSRESKFAPRWLRARCPCAECVEEWSGKENWVDAADQSEEWAELPQSILNRGPVV